MAGGGNFMHKVFSYVVNQLIVDSLANSPSFQRFAVRTSKTLEGVSTIAAKKKQEFAERVRDVTDNFKNQ